MLIALRTICPFGISLYPIYSRRDRVKCRTNHERCAIRLLILIITVAQEFTLEFKCNPYISKLEKKFFDVAPSLFAYNL